MRRDDHTRQGHSHSNNAPPASVIPYKGAIRAKRSRWPVPVFAESSCFEQVVVFGRMDTTFDEVLVRVIRSVWTIIDAVDADAIDWDTVRAAILAALDPFEEAKIAVSAALVAVCG